MTDPVYLRVRRSPTRTLVALFVGALLLFASYDVLAGYWMSGPPEVSEETGEMTTQGLADQRSDRLWGGIFGITGAVVTLGSLLTLVLRPAIVEVHPDRLRLRIGSPFALVDLPWDDMRWIHSGNGLDDALVPTRLLLVHVEDMTRYPEHPWGATWDGSTLMVDAGSWDLTPEEVVTHAKMALDAHRRHEAEAAADALQHDMGAASEAMENPPADDGSVLTDHTVLVAGSPDGPDGSVPAVAPDPGPVETVAPTEPTDGTPHPSDGEHGS